MVGDPETELLLDDQSQFVFFSISADTTMGDNGLRLHLRNSLNTKS